MTWYGNQIPARFKRRKARRKAHRQRKRKALSLVDLLRVPTPAVNRLRNLSGIQRLHFTGRGVVTSAAGGPSVISSNPYTANGMFRPDPATTRQPMLYDQMSFFYSNYRVISSMVQVTFCVGDNIVAPFIPTVCGIYKNSEITTPGTMPYTSYIDVLTNPKSKQVHYIANSVYTQTPKKLRLKWDIGEIGSSELASQGGFGTAGTGAAGTNPTFTDYYHVFCQAVDQASASNGMVYVIDIWYDCYGLYPRNIAAS